MPLDFSKIETTKASQGGNYIQPGNYLCRIDQVKEGASSTNGDFIAIEMTVFHVFDGEHTVGENVSHLFMCKWPSWLANFKQAMMGITGCTEEEVTQEAVKQILDEKTQPLSGDVVKVSAWNIKTKANNKDFTKVQYVEPVKKEDWEPLLSDADKQAIGDI